MRLFRRRAPLPVREPLAETEGYDLAELGQPILYLVCPECGGDVLVRWTRLTIRGGGGGATIAVRCYSCTRTMEIVPWVEEQFFDD